MYKLNPDLFLEPISSSELMIYDPKNNDIHLLNESALFIYEKMKMMNKEMVINLYVNEYMKGNLLNDEGSYRVIDESELKSDAEEIISLILNKRILI